MGVVLLLK
jgi:hypothetical protein